MLTAVDLLVVLEHTVAGPGTHEVVVALAGREAAAHRRPCLVAALASLWSNAWVEIQGLHGEIMNEYIQE